MSVRMEDRKYTGFQGTARPHADLIGRSVWRDDGGRKESEATSDTHSFDSINAACSSCGSVAIYPQLIFACAVCEPKNCTFLSSCASKGTIRPHAAGVRCIARSEDWRDCKAGRSEAAVGA
jgi:hypothetical protein